MSERLQTITLYAAVGWLAAGLGYLFLGSGSLGSPAASADVLELRRFVVTLATVLAVARIAYELEPPPKGRKGR